MSISLFRSLSYYTLTAVFNGLVPFILLPVFTRFLTKADYGQFSVLTAQISIVSPLIIFGLPSLFSVDFNKFGINELRRKSIVWLIFPVFNTILLVFFTWPVRHLLANQFHIPVVWVSLIPFIALINFIPQLVSVVFRVSDKPHYFAIYEVAQALIQIVSSFILIAFFGFHWEGRLFSILLSGSLATGFGFFLLRSYIKIQLPQSSDIKETAKFGLGLIPHSVLGQTIRLGDRLFIVHFISLSAAGEYAVGAQISSILLVLLSAFNQAWTPYLFSKLADSDDYTRRQLVNQSYKIVALFIIVLLIFNLAISPIFCYLVSPEFSGAQRFVPISSVAYFFTGCYLLFTDYIFFVKKTHLFSIVTTLNCGLNLTMNYFFIKRFGAVGVSYAFAISSGIMMLVTWILSNQVYPMPWFYWLKSGSSK